MKKTISVLAGVFITFRLAASPYLVYGQTTTPDPTPAADTAASPVSPTPAPAPTSLPEITPVPSSDVTPVPTATPDPVPSPTQIPLPDPTASPAATLTAQIPIPSVPPSVPVTNSSLEAVGVSILPDTVRTETASSSATAVTVLNTNALGGNPVIVTATGGASLDLSRAGSCMLLPQGADINIANNASVSASLNVKAATGGNTAGPGGIVLTGDATAQANAVNIINTNLIGSCWNFTVLNVFNDPGGNIILPFELPFLDLHASDLHPAQPPGPVSIVNNASISQNAEAFASTGDNTAATVKTGASEGSLHLIGIANTDITRGNWLFLQVHTPAGWGGNFENWWGESLMTPTDSYAWIRLPEVASPAARSVQISNNAAVSENVTALADTGGNTAAGGNVETGNAKSSVNIFDLVNTNIIGNNWYFAVVNLFDRFAGNIVFPRPDLAISGTTDTGVLPGGSMHQTVAVKNNGTYEADNVKLTITLPSRVSCQEAQGARCGTNIGWNLGNIEPGQSRTVDILLQADRNTPAPGTVSTVAVVSTTTDEPETGNNTVVLVVSVNPASQEAAVSQPEAASPAGPVLSPPAPTTLPRQVKGVTAVLADYRPQANGVMSVHVGGISVPDPAGERAKNLAEAFAWLILLRLAAWIIGRSRV